ncbi:MULTISPECIES: OmpA family protein [unclassified Shinella]|uniref:OmpA family protein n=1 Tax=unclassified Shinella TaxID=2643062 RepID=UPI00225D0B44|nr:MULTISPECIES: OmpA family protein [unclassified Shinella]MCO5138419.1 OmpA family protein [Shinella sp.]MDC7255256.1 OmpA family protein [Shinella sp. YE25]CAI0338023.1 OmpA-like domain-containing protein [Rhizobiaceae bacterium]CAK7256488.1 OmpA-like domain-containing protein [Shinella sp. WSC3-e]
MLKRTRLLATVALPIASLSFIWQPVEAAMMRPVLPLAGPARVVPVQAEEGQFGDDLLIPKRRNREDQGNGNEGRQERKRNREDDGGGKNNREAKEQLDRARQERRERKRDEQRQQDDQQKAREERRQRQRDAERDQQRQEENQQRNREERRKKQRDAEREEQRRQDDQQKTREERRQRQRDAERDQQRQEENQQRAREERRKQQRDAEREEQRRQDDQQKAREERRQRQRDAERDEQRQGEERQRNREERQREAERERKRPDETAGRPRRERDKERERIARDPSRTTGTIELPFIDGAAVLDSDKDWDNRRDRSREELRREREEKRRDVRVRVPESDRDAQVGWEGRDRVRYEPGDRERGERRDRRPRYEDRDGWRVQREVDDRFVINFGDRIIVRSDDGRRLSRRATETYYEDLPNGRVREVIERPNGDRVVTIRNRYGEIIQRSRIDRRGREYVMFYAPEIDRDSRPTFVDPGERLPPMRLTIPVDEYIVDTSAEDSIDYRDFLGRPPVEPVERVYSLDEVKYSARIRDKVRRIDLDTITFATGSAEISMNQASTLRRVAEAMNEILDKDPGETFLIEGHTDAVGSDESNLVLSDERAEAVANVLTDVYEIPPENLATQGYGERFLKIDTDAAEQLNRRVTIRRVTPLVKPVAMAE